MFDDNPKVGHSLESYMTGAHRWWKQSIGWTKEQFKRPTRCQSGLVDPPAPRPQNHTSASWSVRFSLKYGLQIRIILPPLNVCQPFSCGPASSICLSQGHSTQPSLELPAHQHDDDC